MIIFVGFIKPCNSLAVKTLYALLMPSRIKHFYMILCFLMPMYASYLMFVSATFELCSCIYKEKTGLAA